MWQLPRLSTSDILIYLRKSRTDDPALTVEEVLSKHEQMLNEWVERNLPGAPPIAEENRYREVVSGETIESRPKVRDLLRRIESPRVKAVLIVEPQRLSRGDLEDIGRIVKILRYTNTLVITLQYSYDLNDERDRDMFERELKRGNEFLEYQKRIMGNGRLLSVQNGNFIGQTPPYGYRKITLKDGKKKYHTLEPDPEKAKIVKMVFELYAQGTKASDIARTLNGMGVPSPSGVQWTSSSVKPMISNNHYIGMVHWNRRKQIRIIEYGELIVTRPRQEEYLTYPGKHPAIIEPELWAAVQEIRGKMPRVKRNTKYKNLFSGLLYCQCGRAMTRQEYKRCPPRLYCLNQHQCGNASCTVEEMTEEIINLLRSEIADIDLKLQQGPSEHEQMQKQLIEQLEHRLDELEHQEYSLWDKYTQEAMPRHIFEKLRDKIANQKEETQQSLEIARQSAPTPVDYQKNRLTLHNALTNLQDPDSPVRETNLLLKQCIKRITYTRSKKISNNRRFGDPEPIELDVELTL